MKYLLTFILLITCLLLTVESRRSSSVHDVVDDFDEDEFEGAEEDISPTAAKKQSTQQKNIPSSEFDGDDEDEEEEQEMEVDVSNDWDDDEFGGSDNKGGDDEDDEFSPPKKNKKNKKTPSKKKTTTKTTKTKSKTTKKKKSSNSKTTKKTKKANNKKPPTGPSEPQSYVLEYIALSAVVVYAMLYFIGSSTNEQKATTLMQGELCGVHLCMNDYSSISHTCFFIGYSHSLFSFFSFLCFFLLFFFFFFV